ncbi:MAG TPA: alpha/beta hydrolase [Solirubrobacterales bacterium]|nr:alpha/beta hydrolase [Solirubrobacterales bacterium]
MSEDGGNTGLVGQLLDEFFPFATPLAELPDPTPAEGPDPYGNPEAEWTGIDWRAHLRRIEVPMPGEPPPEGRPQPHDEQPTEVNYVEMGPTDAEGSRLAVVFVHGLSGSWQNWLENLPHFARRHRVIAPDLPGFGHSPMPSWKISIEGYGHLLHNLCEALGIGDCAVVGNSMGGFICAEAASAQPERFEKLALVSAAGVSHVRMRLRPAETAARMGAATAPLALRLQGRALRRPRLRSAFFAGLVHHPERLRRELILEQFHNGAGRPGLVPAVQGLVGYDILDRLEDVDVPTLIVWGRNDRVVPADDAAGFGRRLHNSRTVIFDHTGHLPQLERPLRFNRVLETFLAG